MILAPDQADDTSASAAQAETKIERFTTVVNPDRIGLAQLGSAAPDQNPGSVCATIPGRCLILAR